MRGVSQMVKVRLQGVPEEVKELVEKLKASKVDILEQSKEYSNRGDSKYIRVYLDVENREKG